LPIPESQTQPTLLRTREVADLFGVHESTVKRWADAGEIETTRTRGGHRRISLRAAIAHARNAELPMPMMVFGDEAPSVWAATRTALKRQLDQPLAGFALHWTLTGQDRKLDGLLTFLRQRGFSLARLYDNVIGRLMHDLGDAWARGEIGVADEHLATHTIYEALIVLRARLLREAEAASMPIAARGPAIVGCSEGDKHELGALMVRTTLELAGWHVLYLGADVPIEEYVALQKRQAADLVAISFVPPHGPAVAQRTLRVLAELYDRNHPYALIFGGGGLEEYKPMSADMPFSALANLTSISALESWLDAQIAAGHFSPTKGDTA